MSLLRVLAWPFRRSPRNVETLPHSSPPRLTLDEYEALTPVQIVREGEIKVRYCTPTTFTKWRVDSLFTKEPDTIDWIKTFQPGEVLVDVGANVGMYTIWAAKTRGVHVYAFEPESQNFALLYRNIVLNKLSGQVVAYCLALSDEAMFSLLHLSTFQIGGSCHTFGEDLDFKLEHRDSATSQGCVSATLDSLVETGVVPMPHHIKIDVDGLEHKVLRGARTTLSDQRLKSVLIEINTNLEIHRKIVDEMESLGFSYSRDQVGRAIRTEGTFAGVGNHVFRR